MPVRLSQILQDTRTITVPVGDAAITVTYKPSGVTPEREDLIRSHIADQRGGAALVALLAPCLVSWDLLGEHDQPVPITPEALRRLPMTLLAQVAAAIMADLRPNPPSGGASAAGS